MRIYILLPILRIVLLLISVGGLNIEKSIRTTRKRASRIRSSELIKLTLILKMISRIHASCGGRESALIGGTFS